MIDINLDFSGLLDIGKELEALSRAENRKVIRDATRAGATVFKDEAVKRAPKRSGKLARNIIVITQRDRDGNIVSGVHVRGTSPTGNSTNSMKATNRNNAFYWRFIELGTSKMQSHPFIRPAFDARERAAAEAAFAELNRAIDRALST